mgnify:CR=1 FL=1
MKRILPIVGLVAVLLLVGTIGFRLITQRSILECLYLSVVTLTTVGNREPTDVSGEPVAEGGMIFMIVYLLCGAGTFGFLITSIGRWMISEQVRNALEKRKMQQTIDNTSGHMIVCGCGQMGEMICRHLSEQRRDFIVIDSDLERLEELCIPEGWTYLHGDATDDGMLERAGLLRASGLAAVLSTDADNLYVVLSAKLDNNSLAIVARAAEESASRKLRQAGASHVINPYHAGAVRIARLLIHQSEGRITGKMAKDIFDKMWRENIDPDVAVEQIGGVISDDTDLRRICAEITTQFPDETAQFLAGKTKVMGFLMGQLMRQTKGKADPQKASQLLRETLQAMGSSEE